MDSRDLAILCLFDTCDGPSYVCGSVAPRIHMKVERTQFLGLLGECS